MSDNAGSPRSALEDNVRRAYRRVLGRDADTNGLKHHAQLIASGALDIRRFVAALLKSEEWKRKFVDGRPLAEAVNALLRCMLGRVATPEEAEALQSAHLADWSRIVDAVVGGSEYGERFGDDMVPGGGGPGVDIEQKAIPREQLAVPLSDESTIKPIAFYLPQFHRIPENDEWWGEGFTEWTNVRRARPQFHAHHQPHIPAALGYYDLNEQEVFERQVKLARSAGIHGFCFYYYWFGGKVLLDLPVRRITESGAPDFPFCLCWANENWTRRWDGKADDILIAQQHSPADDLAFIARVESILTHRNYIRVEGKPMLLVYRPSLLPEPAATIDRWRSYFRKRGRGELHLVMVRSFSERAVPQDYGFDAAVQFPPHYHSSDVSAVVKREHPHFRGLIYDYLELRCQAIDEFRNRPRGETLYPAVMPSWDNTARQGAKATVWVNASPEAYRAWLKQIGHLLRSTAEAPQRLLFINAWNEWAEGCHLEPDERFRYAWLNATALALAADADASAAFARANLPHPSAPVIEKIPLEPLAGKIRIVVSVLFFQREDIVAPCVERLLPQIARALQHGGVDCELFLSFNYEPSPEVIQQVQAAIAQAGGDTAARCHIVENGFNLGFGSGHNAIFERAASDVFVVLNSDLRVGADDWLAQLADHCSSSTAAVIGLASTASTLREDGCGVPVDPGAPFDFVDGSLLAVRSDVARRLGLFSPAFEYFYFEDADLCLRYRQAGLKLDVIDLPVEHDRGSSARVFPEYAVANLLSANRARFFARWRRYLSTRALSNRLAVKFSAINRQLQCASLPSIFALLAEHPSAIVDLQGVHEQLAPIFQHSRIRLVPSWQSMRADDYFRSYSVELDASSQRPLVFEVAEQLETEPDFEAAERHLRAFIGSTVAPTKTAAGRTASVYLARRDLLFDGVQPDLGAFVAITDALESGDFQVRWFSEYGENELAAFASSLDRVRAYNGSSTAVDLLTEIAIADLLVTCDGWASELAQLLGQELFIWLGATASHRAIWRTETTGSFSDQALSCLGCHHRFGIEGQNVCLRDDVACMRSGLVPEFTSELTAFIRRTGSGARGPRSKAYQPTARKTSDGYLSLELCPRTLTSSVLVLTPLNPLLPREVVDRAKFLADRATARMRGARVVHDASGVAPARGLPHPHRQAAMAALRQRMIERHLRDERWVFWVDADIVEYPEDLIDRLVGRAEGGVSAPLVLMEGDLGEPTNEHGFGPGRFYDIAGFVEHGRWARFLPPYFDQLGPVFQLDSVGTCYLVSADIYRHGGRHEVDPRAAEFIVANELWDDETLRRNQEGPANCFTEHYSLCQFARRSGLPVQAFGDLVAYHQMG